MFDNDPYQKENKDRGIHQKLLINNLDKGPKEQTFFMKFYIENKAKIAFLGVVIVIALIILLVVYSYAGEKTIKVDESTTSHYWRDSEKVSSTNSNYEEVSSNSNYERDYGKDYSVYYNFVKVEGN